MADLTNHKVVLNNRYEILTDEGFKDFEGVISGTNENKFELIFNYKIKLICTPEHKIMLNKDNYVFAKDLKIGDKIFNGFSLTSSKSFTSDDVVYDILDVKDVHRYYIDGVLSRQCLIVDELAHIDSNMLDDFWKSVYPTITSSKKSKIFVSSTPNGVGNLFHKLWTGAIHKENGFAFDEVRWEEIPGRDEKWKDETIKSLGSYEAWLQEYDAQFLQNGDGSIDYEFFDELVKKIRPPIHVYDEENYTVYEDPKDDHIYTAGVDTAEGIGKDSSIINIYDITNLQDIVQVAIYANNRISPFEFTMKVNEILTQWGKPLAFVERNGVGAQVADNLRLKCGYEKIVNWGGKSANRQQQNGIICHTNTKFKGVFNMRYWVNELKVVRFNDIETIKEFREFMKYPNGSWAAKSGFHDDRVMSTVWALLVLHDEICSNVFEITETDENNKPKSIASTELNMGLTINPESIYMDDALFRNEITTLPCVFGGDNQQSEDVEELKQLGWTKL